MSRLDVLAIAAHPDDTELCCGGTLARLVRQGLRVGVLDLTRGEMATRGTPQDRMRESERAAEIIGLEMRENLGLPDTRLVNTPEYREKIIRVVRRHRPPVCLVGAPDDRHPDHPNATRLALDALFYGGLAELETDDAEEGAQQRWRPSHILHYMQDRPFEPDLVVDISDTFDIKRQAILAFETQFNVSDPGREPDSYISSERFFKQIEARARHYGHLIGTTYGEPFQYYGGPIPAGSLNFLLDTDPDR